MTDQLLETIAFGFSIMGVIASVSSTYSFPLVSGKRAALQLRDLVSLSLTLGGHVGMVFGWLIPCLFVMTVAASMAELASSMPSVTSISSYRTRLLTHIQHERWLVLLLRETGTTKVRGTCKLDHWLGQHHRTGDPRLLHRLHLVRSFAGIDQDPLFDGTTR